jgi:hypothetical protein
MNRARETAGPLQVYLLVTGACYVDESAAHFAGLTLLGECPAHGWTTQTLMGTVEDIIANMASWHHNLILRAS